MIRRRDRPDGLPFRVYERHGSRVYSVGHKGRSGAWTFRLQCPAKDKLQIAALRREAIQRAAVIEDGAPVDGTFAAWADAWLQWQQALPLGSASRRAESTLAENKNELATLKKAFGHMPLAAIEQSDVYDYLDACLIACDAAGNPRPRAEKGNKEVALARGVVKWAMRRSRGAIAANPFEGVDRLQTTRTARLVSNQELALAVEVGRRMGGPQHICALGLQLAWLCLRRSVEVRALTRDQIKPEGIEWTAAKRQRGEVEKLGLIEWSDSLRATVDEALSIKRNKLAGSWYVFGNLDGQRYTKGGWKSTLSRLMRECVVEAEKRKLAFKPFSLQDCRPKGVTDKIARGDSDTVDATLHSNERMIRQVYDRRRVRIAKPAA